jgi:ABC-type sugar transport system ATPase subunit
VFPHREAAKLPQDLRLSVQGLTKNGFVREVSFDLHAGEILGLGGLMGSGRSELARMIFGLDGYDSGRVEIDGNILPGSDPLASIRNGLAFLTEDRRVEGLLLRQSIAWNISLPNLVKSGHALSGLDSQMLETGAREQAGSLNIKAPGVRVPVATLSGGNQQKVVIAKWLAVSPSVLILDEPTRGIDIGSKVEIYALINKLAQEGMAVLLISSENEELLGLSDRILVLSHGELVDSISRGDEQFNDAGVMRAMVKQERS